MIRIDGNNIKVIKRAFIALKRDTKGKITYNSGLIYIYAHKKLDLPEFELIEVNLKTGDTPPEEAIPKGKMYCPYCRQTEKWVVHESIKQCPICGMSNNDFYVKKFNGGW